MNLNPGLPVGAATAANQTNGSQKVQQVDNAGDLATDDIDDAVVTITPEHANTHKGIMFSLASRTTITSGSTAYFQLKTGAKVVHFKHVILTLVGNTTLTYHMIEAPTVTDGTTALTPVNRNRNSLTTTTTTWYSDPTSISGGTILNTKLLAGSNQSVSSVVQDEREFDLKLNTSYVFSIQNSGAQSADFLGEGYWYEI